MAYNKQALEEMSQAHTHTHTHGHTQTRTRGNNICMQICYRMKDKPHDKRVILCHANKILNHYPMTASQIPHKRYEYILRGQRAEQRLGLWWKILNEFLKSFYREIFH
jgi:hypothetical protein